MPVRLAMLLLIVGRVALYSTLIDRIAVVVNADLIKDSDINRDLLATQLLNDEKPDLSLEARKKDASHLIDQVFIREEIRIGDYPAASYDEADKQLDKLIANRFKGRADFEQTLKHYQLTEADLREQFRWQLTVLRFIDSRFRPAVSITEEQVDKYYSQHQAELKKQNPKGAVDDLKSDAREILTSQGVDKLLFAWLDQHRRDAKVRYLEGSLA